jgi:glycosyltransferase involved in cell wall biosynthesis
MMQNVKTLEPRKICYILSYRLPDYVRSTSLISALRRMSGTVLFEAVNSSGGGRRYFETFARLIHCRLKERPAFYVLGFRGYEIFWIVRLLTAGRVLIVDHMMSPYDSLLNERKTIKKGGLTEKLVYLYERGILRSADIILTDTESHRNYFAELFGIPSEKIITVPVGTDEELFRPRPEVSADENDLFRVFFYGSFQPLHGIPVILEAARLLCGKPVHFTVAGGKGPGADPLRDSRSSLPNVTHLGWVPYGDIPDMIARADLCLGGPFGNTGQARRVITGKTFQFLAMGKPVVVGRILNDPGFIDRHNCLLVPQGSGEDLAGTILWCLENRDQLEDIGQNGRLLYDRRFSTECITRRLQPLFES